MVAKHLLCVLYLSDRRDVLVPEAFREIGLGSPLGLEMPVEPDFSHLSMADIDSIQSAYRVLGTDDDLLRSQR